MEYNLFIPDSYDGSRSYPLVFFMVDASTVGKEVSAPLTQGYRALHHRSVDGRHDVVLIQYNAPRPLCRLAIRQQPVKCRIEKKAYLCTVILQQQIICNTMKKIALFALVALMATACGDKGTKTNKDMNTLSFNTEQAALMSAIACNEAKADYVALSQAIAGGLDAGLTVNQVKEALSQLYAYTGFPRSLNALGTLQKVLEQRKADGKTTIEGEEASPLPSGYDALKQGTEVQTKLSGRPFDYDFCPAEDYYLKAHLFGDIFARDVLTHADRELITVSALCGLENVMPQLQAHVRGALNMGVTEEQLGDIISALYDNGLEEESMRLESAVAQVRGDVYPMASPSAWPLGEPNTAYAKYFTGNSHLAVLDQSGLCNVTFEPGCRNHWHIHHGAVQMLVCVSGRGWYQEWGKPAVELKPGVVVAVPEGVKHWHGATADSWMQHLTYHTDMQPGNSTEWLEPVTDEVYNKI